MFRLISTIAGAALLGGIGYLGYKRFYGSTDAFACDVETPWYLPTPKFDCGMKTSSGEITGRQYQAGQWVYSFANGHFGKESEMAQKALAGAPVQILG